MAEECQTRTGSSSPISGTCGKSLIADQGGEVAEMADGAEQDNRRCGTCRGFRAQSGECRMGLPTVMARKRWDSDGIEISAIETRWPKPPLGADDECEQWAEAVRR